MEGRVNPEESHEPTEFRYISYEDYKTLHTNRTGLSCGSSIIIEAPRICNDSIPNIEALKEHIMKTYRDKIKKGKVKAIVQSVELDSAFVSPAKAGQKRRSANNGNDQ